MRVYDTKGGDFVENPSVSLVVCSGESILMEVSGEIPLLSSPEGLYKRVDIGVNNYSPSVFMSQEFEVYFISENQESEREVLEMKTEQELFRERIEKHLVA
jgi:hypothetical protein